MIDILNLIFLQGLGKALKPAIERFLDKISISKSGCWVWVAGLTTKGYGKFHDGKTVLPHRFIYEYYHNIISTDLTIDHLCRNRRCVNPEHLEEVTCKENILRGVGLAAINAKKTHCPQNHPYDDDNTSINSQGRRVCRICRCQTNFRYNSKTVRRYTI